MKMYIKLASKVHIQKRKAIRRKALNELANHIKERNAILNCDWPICLHWEKNLLEKRREKKIFLILVNHVFAYDWTYFFKIRNYMYLFEKHNSLIKKIIY